MGDKAAIQIRDVDHVATAIEALDPGDVVKIRGAVQEYEIVAKEHIPRGHKIALRDIAEREEILKYGEIIGMATSPVPAGHWVHVHNCRGIKARRNPVAANPGDRNDA